MAEERELGSVDLAEQAAREILKEVARLAPDSHAGGADSAAVLARLAEAYAAVVHGAVAEPRRRR